MVHSVLRHCFQGVHCRSSFPWPTRKLQRRLAPGTKTKFFLRVYVQSGQYRNIVMILGWQMSAEFQVPSPLVPTRENYFVRYCKQQGDGVWAVADVSLDTLRPCSMPRTRRRPSGCLIQQLPNGYSKVLFFNSSSNHYEHLRVLMMALFFRSLGWNMLRRTKLVSRQCTDRSLIQASLLGLNDGLLL